MQTLSIDFETLEQSLFHVIDRRCDFSPWRINIRRCVPKLAELLADSPDEPIDRLAPTVRMIVLDECPRDGADQSDFHELMDATDRLLREMEHLRREEPRRGEWSAVPVTPQMFG